MSATQSATSAEMETFAPSTKMTFGELVRDARHRKMMSQRELEEATGKHWTYLSKIELDRFPPPAAETVVAIANALGQDSDRFLIAAGKIPPDIEERLTNDLDFIKDIRRMFKMDLLKDR